MITEDALEQQALDWFRDQGYTVAFGPDIEPEGTVLQQAETLSDLWAA
jgi:hypothetical protein